MEEIHYIPKEWNMTRPRYGDVIHVPVMEMVSVNFDGTIPIVHQVREKMYVYTPRKKIVITII